MLSSQMLPAFDNPVLDSQSVFRSLLKATSEPGILSSVPESAKSTDMGSSALYLSTWCIARALFDNDTAIYLSSSLRDKALAQSITFQTDARITEKAELAQFAIMNLADLDNTEQFNCGALETPHESCTLLVQVDTLASASETAPTSGSSKMGGTPNMAHLTLSGPGIPGTRRITIAGLQATQIELLRNNHLLYPCGVDIIFCSPEAFLALPRSTAISGSAIC